MHSHSDLDERTARLSVQLQLEDLSKVSSNADREGSQDTPGAHDFACAVALYEHDLKTVTDRYMARSIAKAVRKDAQIIKNVLAEEQQASEDRRLALQANHTTAPALPKAMTSGGLTEDHGIDEDLLEKMCAIYMGDDETDTACGDDDKCSDEPVLGSAAAVAKRQCCSCGDDVSFDDLARAPCGHEYCRRCLQRLFILSLTEEAMFPPRCCSEPIPAEENHLFLCRKLLDAFQARRVEVETTDRTYCHVPGCSKFIPPQNIQHQIATCAACNARTCSICKAAAHIADCPEDPATKALEKAAADNGWRRCNNCRRIVELVAGCNHITCPCGAQFCYLCGAAWKSCTCVVYTEAQLLRREGAFAVRDAEAGQGIDRPRNRQQIRANHECNNHVWWRAAGYGHHWCDVCRGWVRREIF